MSLRFVSVTLLWFGVAFAAASNTIPMPHASEMGQAVAEQAPGFTGDAVDRRAAAEDQLEQSRFALSFYQPTYILPFYYTEDPDEAVYQGQTPHNQRIGNIEIKFQLSFKYPLWRFNQNHKLYIAYTQMSYWQAYQNSAYFRETNYEPEVFLANKVDIPIGTDGWQANFINVGAMHQSNGKGGSMERSWNRAYLNFIGGKGNLMFAVQPWYIFQDSTMKEHNSDIGHYLGYEQVTVAYQYHQQEFAFQARNTIESAFNRAAYTLTWSFSTGIHYLKGYLQIFSGYGQSLIEYNHYTNSIGLGFSLSDWL